MLAKNLSLGECLWRLPIRMMFDAVAAWKGLFGGSGGYFIAIARAHIHFIRWCLLDKKRSVFPFSKKGKVYGLD